MEGAIDMGLDMERKKGYHSKNDESVDGKGKMDEVRWRKDGRKR